MPSTFCAMLLPESLAALKPFNNSSPPELLIQQILLVAGTNLEVCDLETWNETESRELRDVHGL